MSHIKPMQRRRLSPVARAAFQAADSCLDGVEDPTCIFISTYGQPEQSLKLLRSLALDEPVSPAAFSLSVHNAVAGLFSIIHNLTGTSLTMCAGFEGIAAAFTEAAGILHQGQTDNVLLVCFEAPLPEAQQPFEVNPPACMAACYLVTRAQRGTTLALERIPTMLPDTSSDTPSQHTPSHHTPLWQQMRDLIAFLESDDAALDIVCRQSTWRWSRVNDG